MEAAFQSPMRVAIQACDGGSKCVLIANLRVSRPDNWIMPHQTGLTPAAVADIIERALAAGWDPSSSASRASPFELDYPINRDTIGHVQGS